MPYIPEFRRQMMHIEGPANAGELCYVLYRNMLRYTDSARAFGKFAEVLGAVEAAKHEYYRQVVAPHEDRKLAENGDVAA